MATEVVKTDGMKRGLCCQKVKIRNTGNRGMMQVFSGCAVLPTPAVESLLGRGELIRTAGFANARGGVMYIGLDDSHGVTGVNRAQNLAEEIAATIRNELGIAADVKVRIREGLDYIEIRVNPSSNPVSCHGEYYFRSGRANILLAGIALSEFDRNVVRPALWVNL